MFGVQLHNGVPYHPSTPKKVWRKVRKTVCIDSRDRDIAPDSHPGSYTVTLPTVYQNIYAVTLRSIEMPYSFYTFTACARNTSLVATYNGGAPTTITIPDGNYTGALLASTVASRLNTAFATPPATPFGSSYSTVTGRISITSDKTFSFVLTNTPAPNTNCGAALGFPYTTGWGLGYFLGFQPQTRTAVLSGTVWTLTSDFVVNTYPEPSIFMEIVNFNKIDESAPDDRRDGIINGSFAKIPMKVGPGGFLYFLDTDSHPINRHVYSPPIGKTGTLQIRFRFHDGRTVNFNNVEHSFTLELELIDNNFDEYSTIESAL
jgi:hypothetical protein